MFLGYQIFVEIGGNICKTTKFNVTYTNAEMKYKKTANTNIQYINLESTG